MVSLLRDTFPAVLCEGKLPRYNAGLRRLPSVQPDRLTVTQMEFEKQE